jgi:hypothetical protein
MLLRRVNRPHYRFLQWPGWRYCENAVPLAEKKAGEETAKIVIEMLR